MSKGLKLHPKYGVNPTIRMCAWCGKETGEIVLLGAGYKEQAPHQMILNDEPCATCKGQMALGITAIEMGPDHKRTGRWAVLSEDSIKRLLSGSAPLLAKVLSVRRFHVTRQDAEEMGMFAHGDVG